jgi:PAS domain S-box-containing protein
VRRLVPPSCDQWLGLVLTVMVACHVAVLWALIDGAPGRLVRAAWVFAAFSGVAVGALAFLAYSRMSLVLRVADERLRLTLESGRKVAWDWDVASGRDLWIGDLKTMFGIDAGHFAGRVEEFHQRVHPDDRALVASAVAEARSSRSPYRATFRVVRSDGSTRWVNANGSFCYDAAGRATRMLGIANDITEHTTDITDLQTARRALSNLSRRLMEAQDAERVRLARELDTDVVQRVALLTIEFEALLQHVPAGSATVQARADAVRNHAGDLLDHLHELSRRLHSSKLELLGIGATAASYCRDLADRQNLLIDFRADGVPDNLSLEVSLALFRVLQEALANAIRHSGVTSFEVRMRTRGHAVELQITDAGTGFNPKTALGGPGTGLLGLHERLRLIGGRLIVDSRPGRGTTVRARIPHVAPRPDHQEGHTPGPSKEWR